MLSRQDAARIAAALTEILDSARHDPGFLTDSDEDVHAFVERQLIERIGETGKRLHTGRSRNEQISLDLACISDAVSPSCRRRSPRSSPGWPSKPLLPARP